MDVLERGHLRLVPSDFETMEHRVLPHFPFCYLIFEDQNKHKFEVSDISKQGMQLVAKQELVFAIGDQLEGALMWQGELMYLQGKVVWVKNSRFGVQFQLSPDQREKLDRYLSPKILASHLKRLDNLSELGLTTPKLLHTWLRADGPIQVMMWVHPHGDWERIQIMMMEHFVEWVEGEGLSTWRVISKRNIETPLVHEHDYVFRKDDFLSTERLQMAKELINALSDKQLTFEEKEFLQLKMS